MIHLIVLIGMIFCDNISYFRFFHGNHLIIKIMVQTIFIIEFKICLLSLSKAFISSKISCGWRKAVSSFLLGFLALRSKVFWSMSFTFIVQEFSLSALFFLQFNKFCQIFIVQGIGLAQVSIQIQLVKPNLLGATAFFKKQHHRFYTCTGKCSTR